ncbi:MAG: carboxylate-amine ligase [Deltaproteobacteria bacterium]|nr:carboxylate-amine ligase [Deltaproteobacteria bacterium]
MQGDLTIGIEEEFQIIDPETRELRSFISEMVDASKQMSEVELKPELHQSVVEVGTTICRDIVQAREEVIANRREASRVARSFGMRIGAASTHPFSRWQDQDISEGQRYQDLVEEYQEVVRGNLIFGLHVHVGIVDREEAIAVYNAARYFLPHLLAISTSSPFFEGRNTGLKSARSLIWKRLPRTDIPNRFNSYQEFLSFVDLLVKTGCIDDGRRIWWDIRPHPTFSTVEFRVCDLPLRADETIAIAALTQALVAFLIRLHRGNRDWRLYIPALIQENKWRALRYGVQAKLIDFGKQAEVPLADLMHELMELVREEAEALGSWSEIGYIDTILEKGTGADRQLQVFERTGSLEGVVDYILEESVQGVE